MAYCRKGESSNCVWRCRYSGRIDGALFFFCAWGIASTFLCRIMIMMLQARRGSGDGPQPAAGCVLGRRGVCVLGHAFKHVVRVRFQDPAETLSRSLIDRMSAWTGNTIQTRLLSPGPRPRERGSAQRLPTEVHLSFITNGHHLRLRDNCIFCSTAAEFFSGIKIQTPRTVSGWTISDRFLN